MEPATVRPLLDALAAPPEAHEDGTAGQAQGRLGLDTVQVGAKADIEQAHCYMYCTLDAQNGQALSSVGPS